MTLASKVQPPLLPAGCIRRPHLHALLDESLRHRITTVVAGAGFAASPDEESRVEALAAHLAESLREWLSDDLVLVLDDVHELGRRGPALRLIEALCRQALGRLPVVLASREELPFAVDRLRRTGSSLSCNPRPWPSREMK
jgi:ATP/maltotriose-dependent transcriptional regulator MalT